MPRHRPTGPVGRLAGRLGAGQRHHPADELVAQGSFARLAGGVAQQPVGRGFGKARCQRQTAGLPTPARRSGEGPVAVDEPPRCPERHEEGGESVGVTETAVLAEEPAACRAACAAASFASISLQKSFESARTRRKKPGLQHTQRAPSRAIPPPGTIMWTWG